MTSFRLCLALLSLTPLAVCSPAAEPTPAQITIIEPGIEAEQRGEYGFALFTYRYWAHLNVPLAQYRLARLYEHGLGTKQDDAEAAKWYRAASESGYQPAHTALAQLYEQGRAGSQDDALALRRYGKAAGAGDPEVHYQAGRLIEQGRTAAADPRAAAAHEQAAVDAGNVDAQLALAHTGRDLAPVPAEGQGMTLAAKGAVELVGVRDEIRGRLLKFNLPVEDVAGSPFSEQETAAGGAAAVARYRQAARQGDGLAAFKLAQAFEQGNGVPPDLVEALTWYGIAQRQGYAAAAYYVEALRGELPSVEVQEASGRIDRWWQKFGPS